MFIRKEQIVWCENCLDGIYLLPGLKISKELFVPCKTFYRQQDRYGRDYIVMKFPLNAKIIPGRLVKADNYTTHMILSYGKLVFEGDIKFYTTPDYDNNLGVYNYYVISARKGTRVTMRDEMEEMELVF